MEPVAEVDSVESPSTEKAIMLMMEVSQKYLMDKHSEVGLSTALEKALPTSTLLEAALAPKKAAEAKVVSVTMEVVASKTAYLRTKTTQMVYQTSINIQMEMA